jgi:hypothetical protein
MCEKALDRQYCCLMFELEGGKVTDGREHFYDLNNWDGFWS